MQGTDTTVLPNVVVVVQTEPGMVTVGTVAGTVGGVTVGMVTVGTVGRVGTVRFGDGLPPEPLVPPELPEPDEGAPGAPAAGDCPGVPVDAVPCVDADPACAFVPAAGALAPVVVVTTPCEAGAE